MTCPACGAPLVEGARFCASCGTPLQRRSDERRVVTVLFADLVGYTTLAERRDPEQVKNLVDGAFERLVADIGAYGGQVDKIVGDAILALFGAPLAHEDDAERAVRAALAMQRTLDEWTSTTGATELQMRVGINTGEVLVGSLRAGGDYTAMGDVVNTAQRLETTAQPGQTVVGRSTYSATRHVVRYTSLGFVEARGREETVEAWAAEEALLPPGARPARGTTPLLGRDEELGLLSRAIGTAVHRRRAEMVLVIAEAGMGKTRLAEEVASVASCEHDVTVLEGRCVPYGEANVWWPVAEALRATCDVTLGDPLELARERVMARARVGLPNETTAEIERVTNGLLHVMGYESSLAGIDPARAREEVQRSLLALVEGFARQRPVILLLSDLHWADDVVLELGDVMLERFANLPIVLMGTARTDLFERWQPTFGRHNHLVLNLDPLSREATGALLDAITEGPIADDLRDALLDRSGGNPFFLEELVALLAESPDVANVAGLDHTRAELPHTLRGLVAARLDALTTDERCTLQDAAVLGQRGPTFALELMAAEMRTSKPDSVHDAVTGLATKDLLVVEDGRWSFRSDLVREVSYETMTKADRARRHYGVAKWMEGQKEATPAVVDSAAHHYATAAGLVDEVGSVSHVPADVHQKAVAWLDRAVRQAEQGELHPVAVRLCTLALELRGIDREVAERFRLARARSLVTMRELERAGADVEIALESATRAGDPAGRAAALTVRGDLEQKIGDLDASGATLREAIDLAREAGDERALAFAVRSLGMTHLFAGDGERASAAFADALERFRAMGDRRGEAWALQNLAWVAYTSGDATEAESRLHESIDAFTEIGDSGGLGWATGLLAYVRYHQGRYAEAEALGEDMLREAGQRGDRWAEGMMHSLLAGLSLWSGRTEDALRHASAAQQLFTTMRDWYGDGLSSGMLARTLVALGRVDEAFEGLEENSSRAMHVPVEAARFFAETNVACTAAQAGLPHRAPPAAVMEGAIDDIGFVDRRVADALVMLQRGQVDPALAELESLVDAGDPNAYAASSLALARAAAGDCTGADALTTTVLDLEKATYSDRVMAMLAGGLAHARRGDADAAEHYLGEAGETVGRTGDIVLAATVRLARARAAQVLDGGDAADDVRAALGDLAAIGVPSSGWDTAFRLALALP